MKQLRRYLVALTVTTSALAGVAAAPPAGAKGAPASNTAVAVNTTDGASVFRLAFAVRRVADGVVDQNNEAYALASCSDCQTVALAFEIVLVNGDADVVVPENRAVAFNDRCSECLTYASATQVILGFDGPVRFTADGYRRLQALRKSLGDLEERIGELTPAELHAEVTAAEEELLAILDEEIVELPASGAPRGEPAPEVAEQPEPTTTTTGPPAPATTTSSATTTTTEAPTTTTTTEAG